MTKPQPRGKPAGQAYPVFTYSFKQAFLRRTCFWVFILCPVLGAHARSWGDLDEGEHEIYGREREEKLPIRFFIIQKEKWENHESFHFLFFWGDKSYPRYRSDRILPFYYWLSSKVDNRYLFLSPVYYREIDGGERDESILWFFYWGSREKPAKNYHGLFPLYYYSNYSDSRPYLLTPLFWYSRSREKSLSIGFPIIPLVIWDSEPASWDLIFFYFARHHSYTGGTRSHILPLYYYKASQRDFFLFTLLFWYGISGNPAEKDLSILYLFRYRSRPDDTMWYFLPFFYSHSEKEAKTTFSPFYIDLTGTTDRFTMLIPLYLSYTTPHSSLHVNIAGVSLSEESVPLMPVGLTVEEKKIITDWDFGWFYNLFRVSSRKTIKLDAPPEEKKPKAKGRNPPAAPAPLPATPHLTQKRERTRADSEDFFGLYTLFGLFAWEKADHYRHVRLLPLSWLTWDTRNDQGVQTVFPFYIHYRDENTRYLILGAGLPLYGEQLKFTPDCTGHLRAWGLILYWDEYDCATKRSEKSFLWPVVNYYSGMGGDSGFRIFPLFWLKSERNESTHFSPLHYYNSTDYVRPGAIEPEVRRETLYTILGLYWNYRSASATEYFKLQFSPLHYYSSENDRHSFYSWLWYRVETPRYASRGFPLLYHSRSDKDGNYRNFYVLPFYYSKGKKPAETVFWLFPLLYSNSGPERSRLFLLGHLHEHAPGYTYDNFMFLGGRERSGADYFSWHAGLYTLWYDKEGKEDTFRAGYGLLFYYSDGPSTFSWYFALVSGYKYSLDGFMKRHHLLPLWWYSRYNNDTNLYLPFLLSAFRNHDNGNSVFRAVLLGLLYYKRADYAAYDQTELALLGILYYHNMYPERRFDSYGSLWGGLWHYETEADYKRFSILMFLYIRTETEAGVKHRVLGIPF